MSEQGFAQQQGFSVQNHLRDRRIMEKWFEQHGGGNSPDSGGWHPLYRVGICGDGRDYNETAQHRGVGLQQSLGLPAKQRSSREYYQHSNGNGFLSGGRHHSYRSTARAMEADAIVGIPLAELGEGCIMVGVKAAETDPSITPMIGARLGCMSTGTGLRHLLDIANKGPWETAGDGEAGLQQSARGVPENAESNNLIKLFNKGHSWGSGGR